MTCTWLQPSITTISPPKLRSGRKQAISAASDQLAKKRAAKKQRKDADEEEMPVASKGKGIQKTSAAHTCEDKAASRAETSGGTLAA
ncbi:hypothetical protein APHAL10511_002460 [Amanita phalloides]|nr:hypothetical protein APHAL10511_002460 [Amanita phalloides]